MDDRRFDTLLRLFARPASRRQTLAGAAAVALAPLTAAAKPEPAKCLAVGKRCSPPKAGADHAGHGAGGRKGKGKHRPPSCDKCCSGSGAAGADGKTRCACAVDDTVCDGDCVDLQTDGQHCGDCAMACDPDLRCVGGQCVCDATSCPRGCCLETPGTACVPWNQETSDACGFNGEPCRRCTAPETCGGGGEIGECGCTKHCAGKACGDDDGCGGKCDGPCPDDCQTCASGVCHARPDGADCGGAGSGLHCCQGVCPTPTCLPGGSCCESGSTCDDCCSGAYGQTPIDHCSTLWNCLVSGLHGVCRSDADCESGLACQCGVCCYAAGAGCSGGSDCCSGTCNPNGACA